MTEESSTPKSNLGSEITKLLPYSTAALIFLGTSKLLFYYSQFGVNIITFLDFGEIITSFLDVLISFVFVLSYSWMQFIDRNKKTEKETENLTQEDEKGKVKINSKTLSSIVFVVLFLLQIAILIYTIHDWFTRNWRSFIIFSTVAGFTLLFLYLLRSIAKKFESPLYKQLFRLSAALLISEMLIICLAFSDYSDVMFNHKYLGTRILFDTKLSDSSNSNLFTSDSSKFYIGNTSRYIFIHDKKFNFTEIIPMSKVIKIEMRVKPISPGLGFNFRRFLSLE